MKSSVGVIIEKDSNGYYVYCPDLDGCHSQGDTFEEVMANIKEAVDLYLETLSEDEKENITNKEYYTTSIVVNVA